MDNTAKIYTLYFVLVDTITSICNIPNNKEKIDGDALFKRFLTYGKEQYSDLHYDLVAEIGGIHSKAEQEYAKIATKIINFLGSLREGKNIDLIFTLWIAVELAFSFHSSLCKNQPNLFDDLENQLRLGQQKYLTLSQSNSEEWQNLDSIIKAKLGNF
ncbi:hypothetical protein ACE1B6_28195 [Aerosakkonemataceae cyanobacterium BLCC-F154]|uniref:Uncharacterized protein n=1 Tax=Floridaenema fluviatile BLCC-F154 TaxID=3153640 RepID=A0ABV4YMU1_9CYAN